MSSCRHRFPSPFKTPATPSPAETIRPASGSRQVMSASSTGFRIGHQHNRCQQSCWGPLPRQENTDVIHPVVRHSESPPAHPHRGHPSPDRKGCPQSQSAGAPACPLQPAPQLPTSVIRDQHFGAAVTRQIRRRALRRAARDLVPAGGARRFVGTPVPGRQRARAFSGRGRHVRAAVTIQIRRQDRERAERDAGRVPRDRKPPSSPATRTAMWRDSA